MLVISQKKGEKIHIGRDITISIVDVKAGKVRLGIDAPSNCQIMRESLLRNNKVNNPDSFLDDEDEFNG